MNGVTQIFAGLSPFGAVSMESPGVLQVIIAKVTEYALKFFSSTTTWVIAGICLTAFFCSWVLDESISATHDLNKYPFLATPLPLPPERITEGCTNLGLSCWLNASINLMAGTSYFDPLLNSDFSGLGGTKEENNLRELVPLLKIAVNELRLGRSLQADLAIVIRNSILFMEHVEGQSDPADFMQRILNDWDTISQSSKYPNRFPAPPKAHIRYDYTPVGHSMSKQPKPRTEPIVDAQIAPNHLLKQLQNNTPIDLSFVLKERRFKKFESDSTTMQNYRQVQYVDIDATDRLIVNLKRVIWLPTGKVRASNPLQIDLDGTVTLSGGKNLKQKYAVRASLVQTGAIDIGHWYYIEAHQNGKFFEHNDSRVFEIPMGNERSLRMAGLNRLREGTIFFLEKVHTPVV